MKKALICQEAITYLNVYVTNSRNSKYQYMQQKVVQVREQTKLKIIVSGFDQSLPSGN